MEDIIKTTVHHELDINTTAEPLETVEEVSPEESTDEGNREQPENMPTDDNRGSGRKGG